TPKTRFDAGRVLSEHSKSLPATPTSVIQMRFLPRSDSPNPHPHPNLLHSHAQPPAAKSLHSAHEHFGYSKPDFHSTVSPPNRGHTSNRYHDYARAYNSG